MTDLPITDGPLTLRRLRASDIDALLAYRADPKVARYQSWQPMNRAQAAGFISAVSSAPLVKDGAWCQIAVADEADQLIGDMGLCFDAASRTVEVGITLAQDVWGRGFGTRALTMIAAPLFADARVTRLAGIADARNTASIRMLDKAGFQFSHTEQAEYDGEMCTDHVTYLPRPDPPL